ncbi:phosphatidylserine decarboxylase [Pelistega sp. NLN82]|uniref:Phosphatidylserine decarboxylase proenzyme n=1 Tax=Pelistega ratti TaxID=2652177 RepID=A0A6L9Y506_9BURK|nr:archaetidylserine decarboxylase [Pelistega ratti]NEN75275.1 phosphatidylserine decarboxylase [Pelistega ratti]
MSSLKPYPSPTYRERLKIAFHYMLPQQCITRLAGWFAQKEWGIVTHTVIKLFAKAYQVDFKEALKEKPEDYASFNAFFIRQLKEDARPIVEDSSDLCLPADGRISECGSIKTQQLLQAKGYHFTLSALLAGDDELAQQFVDGQFITTYLSPRDYHRVHMPCDATLRKMVYVPGELFSVNPFLARHIPDLFARNERVICVFDTTFGSMVQILVGATVTASISTVWAGVINPPRYDEVKVWEYPESGYGSVSLKKGQEMGAFQLGSTVINLFPKESINLNLNLKAGEPVKMGELLGTLKK